MTEASVASPHIAAAMLAQGAGTGFGAFVYIHTYLKDVGKKYILYSPLLVTLNVLKY